MSTSAFPISSFPAKLKMSMLSNCGANSTVMYPVKPIFDHNIKIEIPDVMYKVASFHSESKSAQVRHGDPADQKICTAVVLKLHDCRTSGTNLTVVSCARKMKFWFF